MSTYEINDLLKKKNPFREIFKLKWLSKLRHSKAVTDIKILQENQHKNFQGGEIFYFDANVRNCANFTVFVS